MMFRVEGQMDDGGALVASVMDDGAAVVLEVTEPECECELVCRHRDGGVTVLAADDWRRIVEHVAVELERQAAGGER